MTRRDALRGLAAGMIAAGRPGHSQRPTGSSARTFSHSFSADVTPPLGHPCMGGGIAPVRTTTTARGIGFVLEGGASPARRPARGGLVRDPQRRLRPLARGPRRGRQDRPAARPRPCIHQHDTPIADLGPAAARGSAAGSICHLKFHELVVQRVVRPRAPAGRRAARVTHVGTGQAKVEKVASNRR